VANVVHVPGPGAMSSGMAFKPFFFSSMIATDLPQTRTRNYACFSALADEDQILNLPPAITVTGVPKSETLTAPGTTLASSYEQQGPRKVHETVHLAISHPDAVCTPADYTASRAKLSAMLSALRAQILYR
jgi:hypothetical protein